MREAAIVSTWEWLQPLRRVRLALLVAIALVSSQVSAGPKAVPRDADENTSRRASSRAQTASATAEPVLVIRPIQSTALHQELPRQCRSAVKEFVAAARGLSDFSSYSYRGPRVDVDGSMQAASDVRLLVDEARRWLASGTIDEPTVARGLDCLASRLPLTWDKTMFEAQLDGWLGVPLLGDDIDAVRVTSSLLRWNRALLIASDASQWPSIAARLLTLGRLAMAETGYAAGRNYLYVLFAFSLRLDVCWAVANKGGAKPEQLIALVRATDGAAIDRSLETAFREMRQWAVAYVVEMLLVGPTQGWSILDSRPFSELWAEVTHEVAQLADLERRARAGFPDVLHAAVTAFSESERCRAESREDLSLHACGTHAHWSKIRKHVVAAAGTRANLAVARASLVVEVFRQRHSRLPVTLQEAYADIGVAADRDPFDGGNIKYSPRGDGFSCHSGGWTTEQITKMSRSGDSDVEPGANIVFGGGAPEKPAVFWLGKVESDVECNVRYLHGLAQ